MAPIISRQIKEYWSDLSDNNGALKYPKVRFKIKEGKEDQAGKCSDIELPDSVCSPANLLKMRALIVTYKSGEKIRYPIDRAAKIVLCVRSLKTDQNVICIDLDGEEWGIVPPSLAGYTQKTEAYTLPTGVKSEKDTGSFDYTSEIMGKIRYKFAIELEPKAISDKALACLENAGGKDGCTIPIPGFAPRYAVLKANRAKKAGELTDPLIVRKAPIASISKVMPCIKDLGSQGLCIGYKGESIKNLQNLVGDAGTDLVPTG
ncbi:hypothetical protein RIF25_09435 [Thermosynechococcaceae cyanobacterium BACA0444]|uniref:Uncharacterized protein n=1 Tax=Pseudocalidococcus azoricus BACA0444 TaxID=2918990 RepID=A0AAE4JW59_9CYAN|nr:hypothetical protein [Pseudocalidococcus azoricus]MDS3861030.1 hypothetical protein [Pseudocalidococcus azoricus BACA0444]